MPWHPFYIHRSQPNAANYPTKDHNPFNSSVGSIRVRHESNEPVYEPLYKAVYEPLHEPLYKPPHVGYRASEHDSGEFSLKLTCLATCLFVRGNVCV